MNKSSTKEVSLTPENKKPRIIFLDNMNNLHFSIVRYLRDLGYDADVLCLPRGDDHFRPEADCFEDTKKMTFIKTCYRHPSAYSFHRKMRNYIRKLCEGYDIIVAQGPLLAFLACEGVRVDISIPYGSDLYELPFVKARFHLSIKKMIKSICWWRISKYQRQALISARVVVVDVGVSLYKDAVMRLGIGAVYPGIPMLYQVNSGQNNDYATDYDNKFKFLDSHDFILFNHSRQHWVTQEFGLDPSNGQVGLKGNDRVIKAYALFLKKTTFLSPILVLFNYGQDVEKSKKLISELGIEKYVRWMPKMQRKHIMLGLSKASLSTSSLRDGIVGMSGVCNESIAVGTPNINNMEGVNKQNCSFLDCPLIHAKTVDDIYFVLIDYEKYPEKYESIGLESAKWFKNNLGLNLARRYGKLIDFLHTNPDTNISNSKEKIESIIYNAGENNVLDIMNKLENSSLFSLLD